MNKNEENKQGILAKFIEVIDDSILTKPRKQYLKLDSIVGFAPGHLDRPETYTTIYLSNGMTFLTKENIEDFKIRFRDAVRESRYIDL